jgi:hypothetical protein
MAELSKIVNSNDNTERKNRYFMGKDPFTGENQENYIKYIPITNYLFATYSKQSWKNNHANSEFCFVEYQLCTIISRIDCPDYDPKERNDIILSIALILEISPIPLFNDKSLPF